MTYKEFFRRYGASYRTKNVKPQHGWLKWLIRRRTYRKAHLPALSELPTDFIRLCPWEGAYLFSVVRSARLGDSRDWSFQRRKHFPYGVRRT